MNNSESSHLTEYMNKSPEQREMIKRRIVSKFKRKELLEPQEEVIFNYILKSSGKKERLVAKVLFFVAIASIAFSMFTAAFICSVFSAGYFWRSFIKTARVINEEPE